MTAVEKAKDLIKTFGKILAVKVVDEILELLEDNGLTFSEYHDRTTIEYWLEIKNEINKSE